MSEPTICARCGHPWDDHRSDGYCDTSPDDGHTTCACPGRVAADNGSAEQPPATRHEYVSKLGTVCGYLVDGVNMCGQFADHPVHGPATHRYRRPRTVHSPLDERCVHPVPPYGQPHYCGKEQRDPVHAPAGPDE